MEEDSLSDSDFGRRDDEGEREGEEGIYADIFTVASPRSPEGLCADHGRHVAPTQQEHGHHCARQSRDNFSLLRESR